MSQTHSCNWPGCPAHIRRSLWACQRHWARIPQRLRLELTRCWQSLTRIENAQALDRTARLHGTRSPAARREALARYRRAEQVIFDWIAKQGCPS